MGLLKDIAGFAINPVTNLMNAWHTSRENRRSREFAREMNQTTYGQQVDFWKMNNAYNMPIEQRKRLEAAGLNPALMYGTNASGASGMASGGNAGSALNAKFDTPMYGSALSGVLESLSRIADLDIKKAQEQNINADTAAKLADKGLKDITGTDKMFDLNVKRQLEETSVDAAKESARLTSLKADIAWYEKYMLEKGGADANIEKMVAQAAKAKADAANSQAEKARIEAATQSLLKGNALKQFEIDLNNSGITKNDDFYWRLMGMFLAGRLNK